MRNAVSLLAMLLAGAAPAVAQPAPAPANSAPDAAPILDTIAPPRDVAYPGTIRLAVDASDVGRAIFRVRETLPVAAAGPLTLLFPKWLPGDHSPSGEINKLVGLRITAGGKPVAWQRDRIDVYAFHIDVPEGAQALDIAFQFVSATDPEQGRVVATPDMVNVQWNSVALYPAGFFVRRIMVDPSLTLPAGWKAATALEPAGTAGATIRYKPVAFDTLIDSPVFAGRNVRTEELAPGVRLNIVADRADQLAATPAQIAPHRALVDQAVKLFGAQHYDHYDFLLALSTRQGKVGLEHHRSSENGVKPGYFIDWDAQMPGRDLLAHEYTHSWNGKYRRPYDLWTPDYRTPMQDDLLWVYEGQTQFWGIVLAARSGLYSKDDALGDLAATAAAYDAHVGRAWRPLADTTNDPVMADRPALAWRSWQRSEDYYDEGLLVWLDADSLIRERSGGARSLDDFARAFFGVNDRDWGELTYRFDDVVAALNAVEPYDWATFLHARLDLTGARAPLDGFTRGGYRLVFTDTPTAWFKANAKKRELADLSYSLGLVVSIAPGQSGVVTAVQWDGPAFAAGVTVGSKIVAIDSRAYDEDDLTAAVAVAKGGTAPVRLLLRQGEVYRTAEIKWNGGLRYPRLERSGTGPNSLDALLAAKP